MRITAPILLCIAFAFLPGCRTMNSQYNNSHGVSLFEQGQYAESLVRFRSAIEANPEDSDSYYNIAAVHHHLGRIGRDAQQYAQAEPYYRLCLSKNPNHTPAYRGLAVWLMEQDRSNEAFELLKNWGQRSPSLADPKIELARLYEENGRIQEAIDHLSAAIALDARNARAHCALGHLREKNSEINLAISNYRYALQYDPSQKHLEEKIAQLESRGPVF